MLMSVQTCLCTLRCCNGDCSTSAPLTRTCWSISSCAAALSSAVVGSTAMGLATIDGWADISLLFTATRMCERCSVLVLSTYVISPSRDEGRCLRARQAPPEVLDHDSEARSACGRNMKEKSRVHRMRRKKRCEADILCASELQAGAMTTSNSGLAATNLLENIM